MGNVGSCISAMVLLAACSSANPNANDAANRFATARCERLATCGMLQDASVDACVARLTSSTPSGQEACSGSRVDECVAATQEQFCPSAVIGRIPDACNGC
jgi:hypothetical protein